MMYRQSPILETGLCKGEGARNAMWSTLLVRRVLLKSLFACAVRRLLFEPRSAVLGLLVICLSTVCATMSGCENVDTQNPPQLLHTSAERVVELMYARLHGIPETRTSDRLYEVLEPGISIYYLSDPETEHPRHAKGEYRVNLFQSRWHITVYPAKRTTVDGVMYEIWMIHCAGQGPWYERLREHRYYVGTTTDQKWGRRTIVYRSGIVFERYDTLCSLDSLTLSTGERISLVPSELVWPTKETQSRTEPSEVGSPTSSSGSEERE